MALFGKRLNKFTGNLGEKAAIEYLKKKKYKILETNYQNKVGEIDIVAKAKKVLVFVEVKSRTSDYFGLPSEAVGKRKQYKIRRVAQGYILKHRLFDSPVQFDVIEILDGQINHIENCF